MVPAYRPPPHPPAPIGVAPMALLPIALCPSACSQSSRTRPAAGSYLLCHGATRRTGSTRAVPVITRDFVGLQRARWGDGGSRTACQGERGKAAPDPQQRWRTRLSMGACRASRSTKVWGYHCGCVTGRHAVSSHSWHGQGGTGPFQDINRPWT